MIDSTCVGGTGAEENQIALAQVAFLDFTAILLEYFCRVALYILSIHSFIHLHYKARAIGSCLAVPAIEIGHTKPAFHLTIQQLVVAWTEGDSEVFQLFWYSYCRRLSTPTLRTQRHGTFCYMARHEQ